VDLRSLKAEPEPDQGRCRAGSSLSGRYEMERGALSPGGNFLFSDGQRTRFEVLAQNFLLRSLVPLLFELPIQACLDVAIF